MTGSSERPPRVAAAILLLTRLDGDLHVYLVDRSPELRFFGGYLALPGGVRGAEDGPDDVDAGDGPALASCAVRELVEELGVALGPLATRPAADLESLRRALTAVDDPETAGRAWRALPEADRYGATGGPSPALSSVCRICTPPFAPVRYDTVFFRAELPDGQAPEIWPGELVGGRFWRPADALAAWRRGEAAIVPPVVILLELLAEHGADLRAFDAAAAALAADYERGRLHRVRFCPGIVLAPVRTPTLPPATTTNCLIVGERELWVVDPATPDADEQGRLFDLLDELVAEGRELRGVLVTHHHPDHVGAVHATAARYRLPVHAHPRTLERLDPPPPHGAHAIDDGDRIPLGDAPDGSPDWTLEAIFTPGHDRGHLCFRESRYDSLIAGDMLSTVSTIVIDPPEGHLRTYLASLERLLETPIGTLHPAHGPALRDGQKLVRQYLRHRLQRETALRTALDEHPGSTPRQLVPTVYWDVRPQMHGLAERSLLAGLEKLAEDGIARVDEAGVWWPTARAGSGSTS